MANPHDWSAARSGCVLDLREFTGWNNRRASKLQYNFRNSDCGHAATATCHQTSSQAAANPPLARGRSSVVPVPRTRLTTHIPPPRPQKGSAKVRKKTTTLARYRKIWKAPIGKLWLNRIPLIVILIGVAYFLHYVFNSGWSEPQQPYRNWIDRGYWNCCME